MRTCHELACSSEKEIRNDLREEQCLNSPRSEVEPEKSQIAK